MNPKDLGSIREKLGKTQKELSQVLGLSLKAIQSFEQGWRKIPPYAERQLLFLLFVKTRKEKKVSPCWKVQNCSPQYCGKCPAREFDAGDLCWFINGTICHGKVQKTWGRKMEICRKCGVFTNFMDHWK